ncbi:MAG: AAA family ATPase [bacterium]
MFIYIGGIPGVGKTTIAAKTIELSNKAGIKMEETGGVAIMRQLAGVSTTEELRLLPEKIRKSLRQKMEIALRNVERQKPDAILLQDVHFVFFDISGKKYGVRQIQTWDKETMLFIAVITASPEIILKRRRKEAIQRPDRQCNLNFITKEQKLEIEIAYSQAAKIGIKCFIIPNNGNNVQKPSELLLDLCLQQQEYIRRKPQVHDAICKN